MRISKTRFLGSCSRTLFGTLRRLQNLCATLLGRDNSAREGSDNLRGPKGDTGTDAEEAPDLSAADYNDVTVGSSHGTDDAVLRAFLLTDGRLLRQSVEENCGNDSNLERQLRGWRS